MAASGLLRCLLVGVRGHGGEEVYSRALAEAPPAQVQVQASLGHHTSCAWGRCVRPAEAALNRLVYPWLAFDLGFRVLRVGDEPDLVHVHSHPTRLFGRRGRPVVFSAGSSHYHYLRHYEGWSAQRISARYARARRVYGSLDVIDALLRPASVTLAYTFSEWARQAYLAWGVPAWQVRVLPPGFVTPAPRPARDPDRPLTFLFLGRQPRRKGGDLLLQVFAELHARRPATRLLYVSDELPAVAPPGVELRPLAAPESVAQFYAQADVFVNPTRSEGYGFTNVEAQGHALPVISTRVGAVPEVVADGVSGLLVPPDDGAALLAALRALADEPARRAELGAAARERFLRHFTRERFQQGLRTLYEEARERAGGGWRA